MKTLLISEIFPPKTGGSGRWFWEIYSRLPRDEFWIAAGEDPRQADFDATHDLNVNRVPLGLREWGIARWAGLTGYGRAIRRLNALVRTHGIREIHCGRCLPEGVMALALWYWKRIPYCCYVHGEDVNTASQSREHAFLVRRVLRHARWSVANSQNSRRLLMEQWGLPANRVCVLNPGVDTTRFVPQPVSSSIRRQLGWGERPVLLTVGRLQKRKGQDQMIRALPRIRETVPHVLYSIVGAGEERGSLEKLVRQLDLENHVEFRGEPADDELIACYQQCDLFALPNREINGDIEGFGMVLLEAQACGRPVLAGASGGTAETMQVPTTGRVVPCETPDKLAEVVAELLANEPLRKAMGKAAREWVVERFDWASLSLQAKEIFASTGSSGDVVAVSSSSCTAARVRQPTSPRRADSAVHP